MDQRYEKVANGTGADLGAPSQRWMQITIGAALGGEHPFAPGWRAVTDSGVEVLVPGPALVGLRTVRSGQRVLAQVDVTATPVAARQIAPLTLPDPI